MEPTSSTLWLPSAWVGSSDSCGFKVLRPAVRRLTHASRRVQESTAEPDSLVTVRTVAYAPASKHSTVWPFPWDDIAGDVNLTRETVLKKQPPPPPPVALAPEQTELRKPPPPLPPVASAPEDAEEAEPQRPQRPQPRMEHCRLYFGALQKAIGGFVSSLCCGQPPEQFISHSKLVIMVGQRLVNTLYKEARSTDARQSLLCKSNHLCALLKQLAVATKKAALHFPDKQALQEAHDFAKELAQRAQHFRSSLEL
ncbi:unnamed protein product [Merluccius merluccius]